MQLYIDFLKKRVHEYWITTKEISSILCILSIDIKSQLSWLIAYSFKNAVNSIKSKSQNADKPFKCG